MEDNIYTLKSDVQQCIVNNIDLKSDYRLLFYDENTIELFRAFGCFDKLKISPNGSLMRFEGSIAKDLIFNEKEMDNIKKAVWQVNSANIIKQIKDSKKPEYIKENERIMNEIKLAEVLEECENESDYEYRKPTNEDKARLHIIKRELDNMGLCLDYEEHEELIMLAGNFEYINFTKEELRYLVRLINENNIKNIFIAPVYSEEDEYDDECKAIRIVIAIDLVKED